MLLIVKGCQSAVSGWVVIKILLNMVDANSINCCSLEIEVKGVMFYEGKSLLDPSRFQKVYFVRDYENVHHARAYWVRYCENNVILGHLSRAVAEGWYYVTNIPSVKYSG